jgi:D-alanine transaminase
MHLTNVASIGFYNNQFLPVDEIKISPLDRGFIFGEGIYTTLACQEGVPLFVERHAKRLNTQIEELYFPKIDIDLENLVVNLLQMNQLKDAAVYIHITRGVDRIRDHIPTATNATLMILAMPWIRPMHPGLAKARVLPDPRWARCDYKTISLLANVQSSQRVSREGFEKVIYHRNSILTEAAQANLFLVKNSVLKTPSTGPYLLNGVTRQILLEEAKYHGIETQETTLTLTDLFEADEVFLTASLSQIVVMSHLDAQLNLKNKPVMADLLFSLYEAKKLSYIENKINAYKLHHAE